MTGALGGLPQWPADGVSRVHLDPAALPQVGDGIGHNRFDDPRPRTADRYVVRYAATTLRGCLLELLDWLRPAQEAIAREAAVLAEGTPPAQADQAVVGQALGDYLAGRRIGRITATNPAAVSINDPTLQAELDGEPAVRALLDSPLSRQTFLPDRSLGDRRVHLDQAAVRLGSELGRDLTRACSLALRDRQDRPDVIHYRSRHDDREDCWAIYDHAAVRVGHIRPLSPEDPEHRNALRSVATQWRIPLPERWA